MTCPTNTSHQSQHAKRPNLPPSFHSLRYLFSFFLSFPSLFSPPPRDRPDTNPSTPCQLSSYDFIATHGTTLDENHVPSQLPTRSRPSTRGWSQGHFTHKTESPWLVHSMHSHWRSWSQFASHYARGTNGVCKCNMDVESYTASNGSCFMVAWIIFRSHLLEVGATQNRETKTLWTLTTVGLIYFIMREDPAWIEIHRNSIWLRARPHVTSHYTTLEGPWPHYMIWDGLWALFIWAATISWSRLLARVWSGPWDEWIYPSAS